MQAFRYLRPSTVEEALALLEEHGDKARLLAGGTDLVIELRNRWRTPEVVIDLKGIEELRPSIRVEGGRLVISAATVMADLERDPVVAERFPALAEAAAVVGSVQIRNRATLVGNICNGSPAADTTPPLLVYGAEMVIASPKGRRRLSIDEFVLGPGKVALGPGEMVVAIELPMDRTIAAAYTRLTRRHGTDLASITLCCGVDASGTTRVAYGSVGPRAWLVVDDTGVLADPAASREAKAPVLAALFAKATPSKTSMRAGPEYRAAMLPVLGARALNTAIERLGRTA
ncbi:MAG: xanthine dehydrogenase family protein subunit M [Acidimicrobiia bacterium]|nr:xanthine dehydrogenase family protein subunit M [Acidimicrobiia bacterium]